MLSTMSWFFLLGCSPCQLVTPRLTELLRVERVHLAGCHLVELRVEGTEQVGVHEPEVVLLELVEQAESGD